MKIVQRFRNKEVTQTKVVKNLLRYYNLATAEELAVGKNWYKEANEFCQGLATEYGLEIWKVAGIVAALSPQNTWVQNKIDARNFISRGGRGFMGQRDRTIKSKKILKASSASEVHDLLSTKPGYALKTKAFYRNILLPEFCDSVCIDRHHLAACTMRPNKVRAISNKEGVITGKQYRFLANATVVASRKAGLIPNQFQAVVWGTLRRLRGLEKPVAIEGYTPMDIEDF
jgi:hypothetical protein